MYKFHSGFAADIEGMLSFRESLGHGCGFHRHHLAHFDAYVLDRKYLACEVTRDLVEGYAKHLVEQHQASIREKLYALRTFTNYLNSVGKDAFVVPLSIIPKARRYSPYIFSDNELTLLFRQMDEMPQGHWDPMLIKCAPVMYRLIYTCGLRPGEGFKLKRRNVNFKTGEIIIERSKKNRDRIVVMSDEMRSLIHRYKEFHDSRIPNSEFLFVNHRGERCETTSLQNFLRDAWRKALAKVGIANPPHIRAYDLRHRFASCVLCKWAAQGMDIYAKIPYLRAYMGHALLSSTMYYVHIIPSSLVGSRSIDWKQINNVIPELEDCNEDNI
ncbi:MAG: tyrosine-type recombinase/integrase [Kiritimatiellae bacterium]|nr:tyrosine-type recombinase/integrase [Kiritimatiellia bacterium]